MTDENKVYTQETIEDKAFPNGESNQPESTDSSEQVHTQTEIPDVKFPQKFIASEVLSNILNTKTQKILGVFQFTKYGAIQVGTLEVGVSGEIKISPVGIVAKNKDGTTTFAIDGDTGDATFLGIINASKMNASEITASNFVAGTLSADNILTGQIDVGVATGGAYVRIDGANNRIIVHDGSHPRIVIGNV